MLLEVERGSNRSHTVENSFWKKLCTSHKTDYEVAERVRIFCVWNVEQVK